MDNKTVFIDFITNESAHMSLDEAVVDFPLDHINDKAPNVSYTFWHILEHIRITQWDLIAYSQDPKYVSPQWPEGYWPKQNEKTDEKGWKKTIAAINDDWTNYLTFIKKSSTDVFAPIPFADNKTIYRCTTMILEHNSYHIGEFGILRQVCHLWPNKREE